MLVDSIFNPVFDNEIDRLQALFNLDLDYSGLQDKFKDLTKLAAKVAGTEISMINLIDMHTQWTISNFGLSIKQTPREDSVCQYTIAKDEYFEVRDLSLDERFKSKFYVTDAPDLRYYYGLPLQTSDGNNIGALCVMDGEPKQITPDKGELLKIIADEIVNRLQLLNAIESLRTKLKDITNSQKQVAHDIRGPVAGIIGLARIVNEQGSNNTLEEMLEFVGLIEKSGNTLLELTDDILHNKAEKDDKYTVNEFNQLILKEKLEALYCPQALNKNIELVINTNAATDGINFSRNKLLPIIGNIVSNAIKFTPAGGVVTVNIYMLLYDNYNTLNIIVKDNGIGIDKYQIEQLMRGAGGSTKGTDGEHGYGFGLGLVKQLIDSLNGQMHITSKIGIGSVFNISLPQSK